MIVALLFFRSERRLEELQGHEIQHSRLTTDLIK